MPKKTTATETAPRTMRRVRELAEDSGLAPTTVYGWISAGVLAASKIGGVVLVRVADWEACIAKHRVGVPGI
jgi:hypothetical protein